MEPATVSLPLSGIKVLDLTRLLPGPLCGQYLADLGAEVIKIEDVGAGDYAKPSLREVVNRGKKSLRLNLKTDKGKRIFLKLAARSDILLESFRPGTMRRLGLSYTELAACNSRLVYCAITGFGQTGPYSMKPGHDINFQAMSGVVSQTGTLDTPVVSGFLLADLAGGVLSAMSGTLVALIQAQRTGHGQMVDVSMTDALVALSALPIALMNEGYKPAARGMGTHTGGNAQYRIYTTLDGRFLSVGAQEKKFWEIFCDAIDCAQLKDMCSISANDDIHISREIQSVIGAKTLAVWLRVFERLDCCVFPVLNFDEVVRQSHFYERQSIRRSQNSFQIGLPFKLSGVSVDFKRKAPRRGSHTREVLGELGYDEPIIRQMFRENVVA